MQMKKILLFIMLMFAVNVLLFNSTSTDLWAKKQAKEQKVEKQKKAVKKEVKAEKAARKEAKEARAEKAAKREAKEARVEKASKREAKEAREEKSVKREAKVDREERTQQFRGTDGRTYHLGPRGGCYYMNANGNKSYVDRNLCK